jgi:glucan biosynthesis protein
MFDISVFAPKPLSSSRKAPHRGWVSPVLAKSGGFGSPVSHYMKRLVLWILISAVVFPVGRAAAYEYAEVTLDYVAAKALARAQKPFHSPKADLPDFLRQDKLDYDKYREIEFRHEDALWANQPLPFRVEFFHPG